VQRGKTLKGGEEEMEEVGEGIAVWKCAVIANKLNMKIVNLLN